MRIHLITVVVLCIYAGTVSTDSCPWHCQTFSWNGWSSCSRSCGGGTRTRRRSICCYDWENGNCASSCGQNLEESEGCNQFCYNGGTFINGGCSCGRDAFGACCETSCFDQYIPYCKSKKQECNGAVNNIRCTECNAPYYPAGWNNGCKVCPTIANCETRHCSNVFDLVCDKCVDDNVHFRRWSDNKQCERMCSFGNHTCWPGTCTNDLIQGCVCATGFRKVSNSTHTVCQFESTIKPSINVCQTKMNGDITKQTQAGVCSDLKDFYGNFQPESVTFEMQADFTVPISLQRPRTPGRYIEEEAFGITDVSVALQLNAISGSMTVLESLKLKNDTNQSTTATSTFLKKQSIMLASSKYKLMNGESLCVVYEVLGGGNLKSYDFASNEVLSPVPYEKTTARKTICYRYDDGKPQHCILDGSCTESISEPLQITSRITKDPQVPVSFIGWKDPIPKGGNDSHASGLDSFRVTVYEVSNGIVGLDAVFSKLFDVSETSLTLDLASKTPKIFCVQLTVKDTAGNLQEARRFVLVDSVSYISSDPGNPFRITSASAETDFRWQTHRSDICLDWQNHFYNTFYLENKFLGKINSDPLITGIYEQEQGSLPVSGTTHAYGITRFRLAWRRNNGTLSGKEDIPNLLNQSFCKSLILVDGETYILTIEATDIMDNSYNESRKVRVDSTPPVVNITLLKEGVKQLLVQGVADLEMMLLQIEAFDPHSGILEFEWTFVDQESEMVLNSGVIGIESVEQTSCSSNVSGCYCPDVGECQTSFYIISLTKLMEGIDHFGYQNITYNFTVKITNNALLWSTEQFDVWLVGDFPTSRGAVADTSGHVVGGVFGSAAFVVILLVAIFFVMRRRRYSACYATASYLTSKMHMPNNVTCSQSCPDESVDERYSTLTFDKTKQNEHKDYATLPEGRRTSEHDYVNLDFVNAITIYTK